MNNLVPAFLSSEKSAEEIIDEVMSRAEFNDHKTIQIDWLKEIVDKIMEILQKVIEKIAEWIMKLLEFFGIGKNTGTKTNIGGIIGIVFLVILGALVLFLIVKLIIYFAKKGFPKKKVDDFQEELIQYADNPEEPYNVSKRYYEEGNMRLSFRYLFIAMLVRFNKNEVIHIHKSKINRIYRLEISKVSGELSAFSDPFFDAFDLCWYGRREISKGEMDSWYEKFDTFFEGFFKMNLKGENNEED